MAGANIPALVQRLVRVIEGGECGHNLGSIHAANCPVCKTLAELLVAVSAGEMVPSSQTAWQPGELQAMKDRLNAITATWRETADIWERQCEEYYPRNPRVRVERPPERARGAIQNWVNWLRACAKQIEEVTR